MGWVILAVYLGGFLAFAVIYAAANWDRAPIDPDPVGVATILGVLWPLVVPLMLVMAAIHFLASRLARRL